MSFSKYLGIPCSRFRNRTEKRTAVCSLLYSIRDWKNKRRSQKDYYSILPFTSRILDNGLQSTKHSLQYLEMKGQMPIFRLYGTSNKRARRNTSLLWSGSTDGLQCPSHWLLKSKTVDNAVETFTTRIRGEKDGKWDVWTRGGEAAHNKGSLFTSPPFFIKVNIEHFLLGCGITKSLFLFSQRTSFLWARRWK